MPQEPPHRRERRISARRQTDVLTEHRLDQLEQLVRALGPAVGQVARIDGAVDDLERWITDERTARRQHFSDMLESIREIRDDFAQYRRDTQQALNNLGDQIDQLAADQQTGRRALITAGMAAVATIVAALAGAVALVLTSGGVG